MFYYTGNFKRAYKVYFYRMILPILIYVVISSNTIKDLEKIKLNSPKSF